MAKKAVVFPGWLSCVINRNICQRVRNYLSINGIEMVSSIKHADYLIYAGCAVTEDAELQSLLEIDYMEKIVAESESMKRIILIGCFPKMNLTTRGGHINVKGEYREKVIGGQYIEDIDSQFVKVSIYDFSLLDRIIDAKVPYSAVPYPSEVSPIHGIEGVNFTFSSMKGFDKIKTQAMQKNFLKQAEYQSQIVKSGFLFPAVGEILTDYGYKHVMIGQGCKNNCAYCAIKLVKTKIVSVSSEIIISQIKGLLSKGHSRFVLLCDDLRSWGLDLKEHWIDLIRKILELDAPDLKLGLFNLKVEDLLEEKQFFDEAIETGKLPYIGLMGQHVNSRILTAMRRNPFTSEEFLDLINTYGRKQVHIHTYNIIGFPGETEEEFSELVQFVHNIKTENFSLLNFAYSERKGTRAATYLDKIPYDTIMERTDRINKAYYDCSEKRFSSLPEKIRESLMNLIKLQMEQRKLYFDYIQFLAEATDAIEIVESIASTTVAN
jgi:tRNA A37 methylthiotransferase MiaB